MHAIRLEEPRRLARIDIPEPAAPGPGEALVRTHRMGVCGTDVSGWLGKMPFFKYPRIPGHELGVEVLAVGAGVANVTVGERCSVEPYMNCGRCHACRLGRGNCCETLEVIGVMVDGGLRERFLVRADKLHRSTRLTFEQLALVETLAIGRHAVQRAEIPHGAQVLIVGAGPIGLAVLEFARLGKATLSVMDLVESRLDFVARTYGIENSILVRGDDGEGEVQRRMRKTTGGARYAVVVDATGNPRSMSAALGCCAQGGTLVYVGITAAEIAFPHPALHKPELTLKASRNALPADFGAIISLIEDGTVDTAPWITHRTGFDRVVADFESFTRPESGVVKAMIELT